MHNNSLVQDEFQELVFAKALLTSQARPHLLFFHRLPVFCPALLQ